MAGPTEKRIMRSPEQKPPKETPEGGVAGGEAGPGSTAPEGSRKTVGSYTRLWPFGTRAIDGDGDVVADKYRPSLDEATALQRRIGGKNAVLVNARMLECPKNQKTTRKQTKFF